MNQRPIDERHTGLTRLLRVHHVAARLLGCNQLRAGHLHPGVAPRVIAVVMRVDDVFHGLARHRLEQRQDVGRVLLELVVDEHDALIGDERGGVAWDKGVADDEEVILDLDDVQLGRLVPELLRARIGDDEQQGDDRCNGHT